MLPMLADKKSRLVAENGSLEPPIYNAAGCSRAVPRALLRSQERNSLHGCRKLLLSREYRATSRFFAKNHTRKPLALQLSKTGSKQVRLSSDVPSQS